MKKQIFFGAICWLAIGQLWGQQNFYFQQWNIEQGLSNQVVRNVAQDSHGYIWLTTEQGLNRFDGQTFTQFLHIPGDTNSISHNLLFGLAIDQHDVVWVGSELGLNAYDPELDQWLRFQHDPEDPNSLSDNYVRTVFVDSRNRIWIGTQNGLNLYDRSRDSFLRLIDDRVFTDEFDQNSFSFNRINDIFEDDRGRIWVGLDGGGVRVYEPNTWDEFTPFFVRDTLKSRTRIVRKVFQDRSGMMWLGTDAGLARYGKNLSLSQFYAAHESPDSLSNPYVWDILEGPNGHLWVSTYRGGVNVLDLEQNKFVRHFTTENGLSSDLIWGLHKDFAGGIWVGCDGAGGLNYHHPALKKFEHHLAGNEVKFNVASIYELASDRMLVSTSEGLLKYDLSDRTYELLKGRIADESEYFYPVKMGDKTYLPTSNFIYELDDPFIDRPIFTSKLFAPRTIVTAVHVAQRREVWIGSISQGLLRVNLNANQESIYFDKGNSDIYQDSRSITALAEAQNDRLWVASVRSGLFLLEPETGASEQFLFHSKWFYEPTITAIVPESDTVLWLGTLANGLIRYQPAKDQVTFFNPEDQPLSQGITGMIKYDGKLWVGTKNGFASFDLATHQFQVYHPEDGLQGPIFNDAVHVGASGKLYFGGANGFNVVDPDHQIYNEVKPKVYFERLSINDEWIKPGGRHIPSGLNPQEEIRLPHDQNYLKLQFSAPMPIQPENVHYQYRLSQEQQWQDLGDRKSLSLPNLPVGNYRLEVKARNNDGLWGIPSSLNIIIMPPFWQTWWFRIIGLLLFVFMVTGFYQYRLRQISRQKQVLEQEVLERTSELRNQKELAEKDREVIASQAKELKELDKVKSKFFANISHELRTPLTLINGPLESFLEREGRRLDPETLALVQTASQNGESLLGLVEEILDLTKLEAGKLPLVENPIMLKEFLSDIFDAYAHDLKAKGMHPNFSFELPQDTCLFLDGRKVKKVLNNLLSNARKFTESGGQISLSAYKRDEHLLITVRDEGRGIDPEDLPYVFDRFYQSKKDGKAEGGTGIGLALSKELARLMNGQLSVNSTLGEGSEFCLQLPFKTAEQQEVTLPEQDEDLDLKEALIQVVRSYSEFFNINLPTLLLAEDNPAMRKFIASVFDGQFRILEAGNGTDALRSLENDQVDLMISDVMMPGMDGFELLNALKRNEELRSLSIIMLTARAAEEDKLFALTKGVDDYLTKPFSKAELLARVKNILENRVNRHEVDPNGKSLNIDQQFLLNIQQVVESHLDHQALNVTFLSDEIALSPRQLQRKLKEITGLSPLGFIKEIRLQKAYRLLANREVPSVADAARKVGFEKSEYFSSQFISRFGKRPSSML